MLNILFIFIFSTVVVSDDNGYCNEAQTCRWTYETSSQKLSITGEGNMTNWNSWVDTPWNSLKDSISSVDIKGVESIGQNAFAHFTSAITVSIGETVETIGISAFESCINLTSITIPENVEFIGPFAFRNCNEMATATIKGNVTRVEYSVFYECSSLESVMFEGNVKEMNHWVFEDSPKLKNVFYEGTEAPSECYNDIFDGSSVSEVVVPIDFDGTDFCGKSVKKTEKEICGQFTTQIGDTEEHVGCFCVDDSTYVEGKYHECECIFGEVSGENKCKSLIECGEFTTEYNNNTNTEECKCVDNASFVDGNKTVCGCKSGYLGVGNECHKKITCGEFTTQYKNTTNTEECQCVDNAHKDTSVGEGSNTCKCNDSYEGNTEKTLCSLKSDGSNGSNSDESESNNNNESDNKTNSDGCDMIALFLVVLLMIFL